MLANPAFAAQVREACETMASRANGGLAAHAAAVADGLEFAMLALGRWLREDAGIRAPAEQMGPPRRLARARAATGGNRRLISRASWRNGTRPRSSIGCELQVGGDLQYIRINGTLVGGLVGLVIFVVSKWLPAL